jgi:hypothetical protein
MCSALLSLLFTVLLKFDSAVGLADRAWMSIVCKEIVLISPDSTRNCATTTSGPVTRTSGPFRSCSGTFIY